MANRYAELMGDVAPPQDTPQLEFTGTTGRSAKNNNPLNLEYRPGSYQDKYDAAPEPTHGGRFAKFPDMMSGYNAGIDQINLDAQRGHTLASFVSKFAPPSQNPTDQLIVQYANAVGASPDTPLSEIDPHKLMIPMLARESSTRVKGVEQFLESPLPGQGGGKGNRYAELMADWKPPQAPTFEGKITKEAPVPNVYEGRIEGIKKPNIPADLKQQPLTKLTPQNETKFQDWIKALPWYKEISDMQGGHPPNLDDPNYDYRAAWKAGVVPQRNPSDQNRYHWADFGGGKMMKSPFHPAAWAEYFMKDYGINPDDLKPDDPRIVSYKKAWYAKYPPRGGDSSQEMNKAQEIHNLIIGQQSATMRDPMEPPPVQQNALIPPQTETQNLLAQMQGVGRAPQTPPGQPQKPAPPNPQLPGYAEMRAPQPGRQMGQPELTNVPPPQMRAATQADLASLASQDTLSQLNRIAANAFKAPADVVHGFATAVEMASEAATGQRSHILTNVTGKAREMLSPKELLEESGTLEKYTGQLMGGLASYMMPGAALKAAGVALPMENIFQRFGSNLLTFAETDVARTLGEGGSVDDAKKALIMSAPTAALFTVAGSMPFEKIAESPWMVRALESASTGSAFALSHAAGGERDPLALTVDFLTGMGIHNLTSGMPSKEARDAYAQKKQTDKFFKDFTVDWEKTNKVTPKEKKQVDEVLKTVDENVKRVPPERQPSEAPAEAAPPEEKLPGGPLKKAEPTLAPAKAEPVEPEKVGEPKSLWEMSFDERVEHEYQRLRKWNEEDGVEEEDVRTRVRATKLASREYATGIRQALEEGKNVPANIVDEYVADGGYLPEQRFGDYPEIAEKQKSQETEALKKLGREEGRPETERDRFQAKYLEDHPNADSLEIQRAWIKNQESKPTPPQAAPKEAWEMTAADFDNALKEKRRAQIEEWNKQGSKGFPPATKINTVAERIALAEQAGYKLPHDADVVNRLDYHKLNVEAALKQGKPVPPEVLKDYPDLAVPDLQPKSEAGEVPVMTFNQFSESRGVSSTAPTFPEAHRAPGGVSKPVKKNMMARIAKAGEKWGAARDALRKEYDDLVGRGELRPPTRQESLEETAKLDTEAGAAARRLLAKKQPQPEPAGKAEGETKLYSFPGVDTTPLIKGLVNRAVESGKEAHTMVQQATRILKANLASDSLSETARKASEMVMGNAAARDTEVKRMTYEMRGFKDYAGPIDGERTLTFAKQYQSGQPVTDPVMKALGDTYRQEERRQMETMRDLGKSPADLANYLDQLWDLTPEQKDKFVSTILGTRPRTVQGPKYFFKQRVIPDIPTGIAAGIKPRYDNIVDMMLAGRTAREKFIEGQRNIQGLRDNGWLKNVRSPKDVPEGWVILPDPFGTIYTKESRPGGLMVPHEADEHTMPLGGGPERMAYDEVPKFSGFVLRGFRAVPEDVATVYKNYLGRGLEGNPLNTAIQKPIHAIRMSQVALSAAHLSIEGFNAMSVGTMADMGDLLGGMIAGDATRFKRGALGMASKPIPFIDLIRMANRGRKLTIAGLKPEYATPENVAMLKQLQAGGTRIEPQYKFWSEMMGGHLKDALGAMQEFRPFKAGMSTLRALSSGIMDFVVPFTKLGANERIYLREVDRFTAKNGRPPTAEELQSLAYDAQKFADNMFGKMVADNLGMNRTIKSLLSSVIQFPTWNVGSVKWGAGNIRFGAKTLKQAADLLMGKPVKPMDAQARLAVQYTAGLLFSVGLIGGMTNYLMTGEPPKELLDFYYPRSGAKRPDGSAERIQFLTYLKDVVGMRKHPAKTVWAKTAAPLHMLNDLINNRDYWGNYIVDPDEESPFKKIWDVLKYGVGSAKPFSLQGWQASEKRTPGMAVLNVFGARPTPKWLLQTPAEEKIAQYQEGKTRKAMTPEEAAISKSKYDAIKDFREGKVKDANNKIDALIADGKLSESKVKPWLSREGIHFVKEGDKTILKVDHPKVVAFKYLDIKQALEAYRVSNKEEKKLYAPVLKKKINNLKDDEYDRLKPKINKALGIEEKPDEIEQDFGKPRRKANG